jgi:hypothetical protein
MTDWRRSAAGFEYYTNPKARTSGHITWVSEGEKSWTLYPAAIGPNAETNISQRLIPEERMAMVRLASMRIGTIPHAETFFFVVFSSSYAPPLVLPSCPWTGSHHSHCACLFSSRSFLRPPHPLFAAQVINFGMSTSFQSVNFNQLTWPAQLLVDYVRVYQRSDGKVGCDPPDENAYTDANLTSWAQAGYTMPVS